jgi:hypothetical protein
MPKITEEKLFDGSGQIIQRLGFEDLLSEVREILTGFVLTVSEKKDSNGASTLRKMLDKRFSESGGWVQKKSGGVDWTKQQAINGRPRHISLGVELQVSGRSDLIAVDLIHLRTQLLQGMIDLAVLVVPSDALGYVLTDRVAKLSLATRHIEHGRFEDMPFVLIAIEHDEIGPSLPKLKYMSKA